MVNKLIVGLSGAAGCGKSYVANWLTDYYKMESIAFADPIKRIAKEIFDFTDEQLWGASAERNKPDLRYWRLPLDKKTIASRDQEHRELWRASFEKSASGSFNLCTRSREDFIRLSKEELKTYDEDGGYLTPRFACQRLGTEYGRTCYNNVWIDYAFRTANALLNGDGESYFKYDARIGIDKLQKTERPFGVTISDVRFMNEFDAVRNHGGKLVRIKRDSGTTLKGAGADHQSEKEQKLIPDSEFDYVLQNVNDLEELGRSIREMMAKFSQI